MGKTAVYFEEAQRLYIQEGKTHPEIARQIPVSERTIQRWSKLNDWPEKRKEYLNSQKHFSEILKELQQKLAEAALKDPNPQNIYALCRIIAVVKPSSAVELRNIEKEETESKKKNPEEMKKIIDETLENYYGIK